MDALDTRSSHPSLRTPPSPPAQPPTPEALREVARITWQLPVLLSGGWSPAPAVGNVDALLRLQAAVWELAARHHVLAGPDDAAVDVARLLAHRRVLAPGAARAVAVLAAALDSDGYDVEACRLAARLVAHLELRARFG